MRSIVVSALSTLDGVQDDPMSWMGEYFDEHCAAAAVKALDNADAMLMGRGTYEYFAPVWPQIPGPHADRVNGIKKYVVSNGVKSADWANSEVMGGDPYAAVSSLINGGDGDLLVYGYGEFANRLVRDGLVSRVEISVFPMLLGSGRPMLRDLDTTPLTLEKVETRPSGVVQLAYAVRG